MSSAPAEKFTGRLNDLRTAVAADATALQNTGRRTWLKLDTDSDEGYLNPFDKEAFAEAFDREEANKAYVDTVQEEGNSYRDMQSAKVQGDVLSAFERDLSMRYRSRVRMVAHAAARLKTHGLNNGPINNGIMNFVKLLMAKGG